MAGGNDLRALFCCHLGEELIGLALAEDFEVGIWFVEQEGRLGVGIEVGEQQQRLLQAEPGAGNVQERLLRVPIGHRDFRPLQKFGRLEVNAEQSPDVAADLRPTSGAAGLTVKLMAEVAEHLGGFTLANEEADFAGLLQKLSVCQPRHRR